MLHYLLAILAATGASALEVNWVRNFPEAKRTAVAKPGEDIVFKWAADSVHNVWKMKSCTEAFWDTFECPSKDVESDVAEQVASTDVREYTETIPDDFSGVLCFYCQVFDGAHCNESGNEGGQHLVVKVPPKPEPKPIYLKWETNMKYGNTLVARPGQKIVFNWEGDNHNVVQLSSCDASMWKKFQCPETDPEALSNESGYEVTVDGEDQWLCFYCSIGNHCKGGQYSVVKVVREGGEQPEKDDKAAKKQKKEAKKGKKEAKAGKKEAKAGKKAAKDAKKKGQNPKGKNKKDKKSGGKKNKKNGGGK